MEKNLTTGNVGKTLIAFSLPYLLSYFLQTLYGMADLFIIGQFNSVAGTTAVSIGSQVMHMLTVMLVGLAMGSTVIIGRSVGANDKKKMSEAIGNTVVLFLGVSVALTIILLILVKQIIWVLSTPEEAVAGTMSYLLVCFLGIPLITAYNIISSIFRGIGDSKSPMYFVAVACFLNIALDYLFIGAFGMGPVGAALGTVLAQTFSVVTALIYMRYSKAGIRVSASDFKPKRNLLKEILSVGIPVSLQDGFIQVSFIIITIIVNRRGLNDAAAVGIVEKMISILFLVPSSMLSSVSALAAQNIGAKKHDRAKETLWCAMKVVVIWGLVISILMQFVAEPAVGLFTDNSTVIQMGGQYMHGYVWDSICAGIHFCFSGYFCAYGFSEISFLHNCISIVCGRIPLAYLASKYYKTTLLPMGIATTLGSSISIFVCVIAYIWMKKHPDKVLQRV